MGIGLAGKVAVVTSLGQGMAVPSRLQMAGLGKVEVWRGCCRSNISVAAPFVWRCLTGPAVAPSPHAE